MQLDLEDRVLLTKCGIYRLVLICVSERYDLDTGRYYLFGWKSWGEVIKRFTAIYPPYKVCVTVLYILLYFLIYYLIFACIMHQALAKDIATRSDENEQKSFIG